MRSRDRRAAGKPAFLRQCVSESLRLYPPEWRILRFCARDAEVCGYQVPRGSVGVFSPYLRHRDPEYWVRPDEFDPERVPPRRAGAAAG